MGIRKGEKTKKGVRGLVPAKKHFLIFYVVKQTVQTVDLLDNPCLDISILIIHTENNKNTAFKISVKKRRYRCKKIIRRLVICNRVCC